MAETGKANRAGLFGRDASLLWFSTMVLGRPLAFFALALFAAPLLAAPLELKVVGDHVNLRSRPVADSEVVGQVSAGETLLAPDGIPEGAEWVKVRPPSSTDLWIFAALVSDGVVTADDTYVRCGPGQHFKPVGKVPKGQKVELRGAIGGDWLRIAPVPTAELYVSSAYVLALPQAKSPKGQMRAEKPEVPSRSALAAASVATVPAPVVPPPPAPKPVPAPIVPSAVEKPKAEGSNVKSPVIGRAAKGEEKFEPLPAALAGLALAPVPRQGETVRFHGRLERLSLARAPGFTRYQLIDKAGYSKSAAICRIIGLSGQWFELDGSEIEVEGRLWTLYGDSIPVLDAIRVRRVASWEK